MKRSKLLLAVIMFSTLACAKSFAGNGAGVNGPDLSGDAMPITMDREIEVDKIREVEKTCQTQLLQQIWLTAYGEQLDLLDSLVKIHNGRYEMSAFKYVGMGEVAKAIYLDLVHLEVFFPEHRSVFMVKQNDPNAELGVPYIQYDIETVDRKYDEWGREQSSRDVVRNLRMHNSNPSIVKLTNSETQKPVGLTLDFRNYRDCLLNGIQQ